MPLRYEQNPKGKWHTNTKCPHRLKPTDMYGDNTVEKQLQYIEGYIIGPPKPGAYLTVEKLASMGMVGLYSDTEMAQPEEVNTPFDKTHPLDTIKFDWNYDSILKMSQDWMKESEKFDYNPIFIDSMPSYYKCNYGGPGTGKSQMLNDVIEKAKKMTTSTKIKLPKHKHSIYG